MKRADVVSVRSLFSGASRYRCGPARPGFHWGPPEVAQLVVDLENGARDSIDDEDVEEERLYLGIVTVSHSTNGQYTLLDGQQRLAVLTMYLAFARDRLHSNSERNRIDRMIMRRALGSPPEARLRLAPEDHAWFSHFILPPGATTRLPPNPPLGSPRQLLLAARFMEHAFAAYGQEVLANIVDFLLHHTAVVRSLAEPHPSFAPPAHATRPAWNQPEPSHYRVAAE
jgi:hypothetical protein